MNLLVLVLHVVHFGMDTQAGCWWRYVLGKVNLALEVVKKCSIPPFFIFRWKLAGSAGSAGPAMNLPIYIFFHLYSMQAIWVDLSRRFTRGACESVDKLI